MDKIDELLNRGVDGVLPSKSELEKVLRSGKKLKVYQGFDPTSPELHIGHLIGLRKLRQWQELGHHVIFLIGDFTGRIGDPSGKDETRPSLTKDEVDKNAQTYKEQAAKILDFDGKNPVSLMFNSSWSDKMSLHDFFTIAARVTFQQLIERDLYQKRLKENKDLSLVEMLYPLMQGYDSVAMDVDVEVGGRDQLFNMMMGRHLMQKLKGKNKFVLTTQLLIDKEGRKVGKTTGNAVAIADSPDQIFGAIMSFPDEVIIKGLECLTDVKMEKIESIEKQIKGGKNPLEFKKLLAFEVVKQLSDDKSAQIAQKQFESIHQKGILPADTQTTVTAAPLINVLINIAGSKSQAKRLLEQNAIEIDGEVVSNGNINLKSGQIIKVGKKTFVKVE
ncbi:tyrosine--tRNA ligase [Candidatus Curtissbacteria bacterium RIFCSPHIGHO2_01_FULL_41_11]|uniref:Tyrosine--tRNA ligase n=1 Tax=Candidatus Curtissbacteria bacterium RIFCSPHIGHO2_01_FULL_41_11 TaxID=1797711 RepID=A0A1F5G5S9_9BACT|nr:MAG: tyrosine--tRNA ligase [Candidatus Curtissbacteria bacterium RIFCSPHIGHO2_01_FULL_41_11]